MFFFLKNWPIDHHTSLKTVWNDQLHQFNMPITSILTRLNKIPKSDSIQTLEFPIFHKIPNWSKFSTKIMNITIYQQNPMINFRKRGLIQTTFSNLFQTFLSLSDLARLHWGFFVVFNQMFARFFSHKADKTFIPFLLLLFSWFHA